MLKYKNIIIYYFSGTGNSRNVARWFCEIARENGSVCMSVDITKTDRLAIEPTHPDTLVVFTSPIHGFNYPPVMLNFIRHFPKGKSDVVLMNTRAGMLIGEFVTPGITGIAFYLSALILRLKGYKIRGIKPVDMPSNWISVHPGLNARTVQFLHEKNKERVQRFARKILDGKPDFKALIEMYDLLLLPISIMYFLVGRFLFAKTYYASSDCNNCNLCISNCPVQAIKMVDNRPFWTFHCESCMKCMSNCPKKAIETAHGSTIEFSLIFYGVFMFLIHKYFDKDYPFIQDGFTGFVIETLLFLGILAIWYRLTHYLIRFRFFERLMVYTSLTKYKFWGRRYKALKE